MPQHPAYTLQWYEEDQAYHVFTEQGNEALEALPESPAWQAWLHSISSFAFHGKTGSYTACKESKVRGEDYWYAYVRIKGKVTKRYLGLSTSLTLARLEQVAQELATSQQAERWHEETVLGSATPISLSDRGTPRTDSMKGTSRATAQSPPVPRIMTKVQAPRLRSALVSRLIQRLQEGMKELLTLISAPAGFRKTTLLTVGSPPTIPPPPVSPLNPRTMTRFVSSPTSWLRCSRWIGTWGQAFCPSCNPGNRSRWKRHLPY